MYYINVFIHPVLILFIKEIFLKFRLTFDFCDTGCSSSEGITTKYI